jgi:hypothetical protein
MGAAVGDLNGDGHSDLVVSNFFGRSTIAFVATEGGRFVDSTASLGLTAATRSVLGFGVALVDLDGDGLLDLVQANGHVLDRSRLGTPFAMRPTLLRNRGGRFEDVSAGAGAWWSRAILGRGVAVGDLDNDGRPDVVVNAIDSPSAILHNESAGTSVVVELVDKHGMHPLGGRLRAFAGGHRHVRDLPSGGSYLSASDTRAFLGLGQIDRIDRIEVTWPTGRTETWIDLPVTRTVKLLEGSGRPEKH